MVPRQHGDEGAHHDGHLPDHRRAGLTTARDDAVAPLLWATAYGFCILFSYYIMRAVRDEISSADRGNNTSLDELFAEIMGYAWCEYRQSRRLRHVVKNDDAEG